MNEYNRKKIKEWFIESIKENLAWVDADISEERIEEIAEDKTNDLIKKCFESP